MTINFHYEAGPSFESARQVTREVASPVLEMLSSCFQINWFRETSSKVWIAVIKPSSTIAEHFGLTHEYFVIGNGYSDDFHQRTLKQAPPEGIADRLDPTIRFVASSSPRAEAFCAAWAQKNKSTLIVLKSIATNEISAVDQLYKMLSASLWRRDFFAEAEPVRNPTEFFGREVVVNELYTKILLGSPVAIFGLRKIGKSSLLGRLEDLLEKDESAVNVTVSLIGNSTRLKSGRWWHAAQDAVAGWQAKLQNFASVNGSRIHAKAERLGSAISKKELDSRTLAIALEKEGIRIKWLMGHLHPINLIPPSDG